ncbi:hypothetical protein WA026_000635 [Henosepilachna vigintioctopunctata]|uniref:Uncharacterized protein n=1 Tax=Henosepilachna vigintioctopunctata TaxID=420089 RepID=A0AAW1V5K3_9CUCU
MNLKIIDRDFLYALLTAFNTNLNSSGATSGRRFNVTVVSPSGVVVSDQIQTQGTTSPVPPRHRGQPFASIPEDHPLDDTITSVQGVSLSGSSRCPSPAPSWDFSLEESDSGFLPVHYIASIGMDQLSIAARHLQPFCVLISNVGL